MYLAMSYHLEATIAPKVASGARMLPICERTVLSMFSHLIEQHGDCICTLERQRKISRTLPTPCNSCKNSSVCISHINSTSRAAITPGRCGKHKSIRLSSGFTGGHSYGLGRWLIARNFLQKEKELHWPVEDFEQPRKEKSNSGITSDNCTILPPSSDHIYSYG